jgi:hypothetical protein
MLFSVGLRSSGLRDAYETLNGGNFLVKEKEEIIMNLFRTFFWRITSAHVITYFLAGALTFYFLDYRDLFETPPFSCFMKPTNSTSVAAGPALQLIRGVIFSMALWPFRDILLKTKYGWLKLWGLLIGLSILSTTAAAPGSIEGFIYTTIPIRKQVIGYLEVIPQTMLFSLIVFYWYEKPKKAWQVISIILVLFILLVSLLGLIAKRT